MSEDSPISSLIKTAARVYAGFGEKVTLDEIFPNDYILRSVAGISERARVRGFEGALAENDIKTKGRVDLDDYGQSINFPTTEIVLFVPETNRESTQAAD